MKLEIAEREIFEKWRRRKKVRFKERKKDLIFGNWAGTVTIDSEEVLHTVYLKVIRDTGNAEIRRRMYEFANTSKDTLMAAAELSFSDIQADWGKMYSQEFSLDGNTVKEGKDKIFLKITLFLPTAKYFGGEIRALDMESIKKLLERQNKFAVNVEYAFTKELKKMKSNPSYAFLERIKLQGELPRKIKKIFE